MQKKIIFNICPLERFVYSVSIDKSKEDTPELGIWKGCLFINHPSWTVYFFSQNNPLTAYDNGIGMRSIYELIAGLGMKN